MMSLLLNLNNFHTFFSVFIVDFKQVNVYQGTLSCVNIYQGTLSCVNIVTLSLYSKSKDEQMLYLTSIKITADFRNC